MAAIGSKGTQPEMLLRKGLHALGWRYRLHGRSLSGKPDLIFPGRRAVIFANGCFWHGHACHLFKWPKTRADFWQEKITANIERDLRVREQLMNEDWRIGEVWECTVKGRERLPLEEVLARCDAFLRGDSKLVSIGSSERIALLR